MIIIFSLLLSFATLCLVLFDRNQESSDKVRIKYYASIRKYTPQYRCAGIFSYWTDYVAAYKFGEFPISASFDTREEAAKFLSNVPATNYVDLD